MLVLIDDIKLRDENEFLAYINTIFSGAEFNDFASVSDYLLGTKEQIEFLVSDYDEIEDKSFASKVMKLLTDVSGAKENVKLTQM